MRWELPKWIKATGIALGGFTGLIALSIDVLVGRPDSKALKIYDRFEPILNQEVPAWAILATTVVTMIVTIIIHRLVVRSNRTVQPLPALKPVVMPYNPAYDISIQGPILGNQHRSISPAALEKIDEAIELFELKYDRKKNDGFRGWVKEDLSELCATTLDLIHKNSSPSSVHVRLAEDALRNEPDLKSRMLMLHGILCALRNSLSSEDEGSSGSASKRFG